MIDRSFRLTELGKEECEKHEKTKAGFISSKVHRRWDSIYTIQDMEFNYLSNNTHGPKETKEIEKLEMKEKKLQPILLGLERIFTHRRLYYPPLLRPNVG